MYSKDLEELIDAALADGVLTEKEKQILFKKAKAQGIDLDEFEMVLDARLVKLQKAEQEKKAQSSPKSHKLGDVRKCPQCGAVIGSFQMVCPECGFEFSNVGVNDYVKTFAEKLEAAISANNKQPNKGIFSKLDPTGMYGEWQRREWGLLDRAEAQFVKNYPLPMTKEDCVEALNYILPKISLSGSNAATFQWKKKYNAILKKLEIEAKGNQQILDIVKSYRERGKTSFASSFIIWYRSISKRARLAFWSFLFCVVFYGFLGAWIHSEWNDDEPDPKINELVAEYVNQGNIAGAVELINKGANATPLYNYYMDNAMWDEAEDYIPHHYSTISKDEYFNYCKKAVTAMSAKGKRKEAKKFIKRKVAFYEQYNDPESSYHKEWNTMVVEKRLNAIVDNY
jgi:hypothetical protein